VCYFFLIVSRSLPHPRVGIKVVEQELAEERGEYEFDGTEIEDSGLQEDGVTPKRDNTAPQADTAQALQALESQLTPVQKYMIAFAETHNELIAREELEEIHHEVEGEMKEWDLQHLRDMKEEEEQLLSEDEDMLTFEIADSGKSSREHYEMYREELEKMSSENLIHFGVETPQQPAKVIFFTFFFLSKQYS
jgi:hypothetical protein